MYRSLDEAAPNARRAPDRYPVHRVHPSPASCWTPTLLALAIALAGCGPSGAEHRAAGDAGDAGDTTFDSAPVHDAGDAAAEPDAPEDAASGEDVVPDAIEDPVAIDPGDALPARPGVRTCVFGTLDRPDADVPVRLSTTGCVDGTAPAAEFVPYEVNAALWTDGAGKARYISTPLDAPITVADDGRWTLPVGTVLLKHFAGPSDSDRADAVLETRFMARTPEGWLFRTYRWDDDGADATLVRDGTTVPLVTGDGPMAYVVPDETQCGYCHAATAEEVLGPRPGQLDRDVQYASGVASQLDVFVALGVLDDPSAADPWPDPFDETAPLEPRARAWLAANCGHCHQPGGWRPPELTLDLQFETSFADTNTCGERLQYTSHVPGEVRIEPGDPDASNLWLRMTEHGLGRMPSLATNRPDPRGIALVRAWIQSMDGCP